MKKLVLFIGITCLALATSYGALQCGICKNGGKKFFRQSYRSMVVHLADVHDLFLCQACPKFIAGSNSYKLHVKMQHQRIPCMSCITRDFLTEGDLVRHKDAVHMPLEKYRWCCPEAGCKERGETFPTFERLIIHQACVHKKYVCPHSSKFNCLEFSDAEEYCQHRASAHCEFICMQCNMRVFKSKDALEKHMESDHKVEKENTSCDTCGCTNLSVFEKKLHEFQCSASLLYFLEQTSCIQECCGGFHKRVVDAYTEIKRSKETDENKKSVTTAVAALAMHVLKGHKRCLFCENFIENSDNIDELEKTLNGLNYEIITENTRKISRQKKDYKDLGYCDVCFNKLMKNRKSRFFSANIESFPFSEVPRDFSFYHLEYDEKQEEDARKKALDAIGKKTKKEKKEDKKDEGKVLEAKNGK